MATSAAQPLLSPSTLELFSDRVVTEQLEQWLGSSNEISIFLGGRTGAGKSTLVNALLGGRFAEEGKKLHPTTSEVTCHEHQVSGILVKVWDSPGLQDGTPNEEKYLTDIAAKCGRADLFLYCINIGDAKRFNLDSPDVKALAKLANRLNISIWDHALIALTFANRLSNRLSVRTRDDGRLKEQFCDKIREWQELLRQMLQTIGLSPTKVSTLRIIPTGQRRRDSSLPDRPHWLSTFWFEALRSTHPRAQPALLHMNETRLVENPEMVGEKVCEQYSEDRELIYTEFGREVGKMLYGSEELGSKVGLEIAQNREMKLKEKIILEQFLIMRLTQSKQGSDPTPPQQSHEVNPELLESLKDISLSKLIYGPPEIPATVPPVPSELAAAAMRTSQQTPEIESSCRSECGGPPN